MVEVYIDKARQPLEYQFPQCHFYNPYSWQVKDYYSMLNKNSGTAM